MSWRATAYVAEIVDNITRSEKLLLLCLSNRFNDDENCSWASVPKLARQSLMSERTAHRALDGLAAKGFISIGLRPGQSSVYLITGVSVIDRTTDKMAGVVEWRNGTPTPAKMDGTSAGNGTPPLPKELITRITLDTTVADEQRTVNEPSIEPSVEQQQAPLDHWPAIRPSFEDTFGLLGGDIIREAREYACLVPQAWFLTALEETRIKADRPSWRYTKTILDRCIAEQRPPGPRPTKTAPGGHSIRDVIKANFDALARGN